MCFHSHFYANFHVSVTAIFVQIFMKFSPKCITRKLGIIYTILTSFCSFLKGIDYCPIEIIKGLTDKGQFQYLTNLKGPQVGNYLYTTQFL